MKPKDILGITVAIGAAYFLLQSSKPKRAEFDVPKRCGEEFPCPSASTRIAVIGDSYGVGLSFRLKSLSECCGVPFFANPKVGSGINDWKSGYKIDRALASNPTLVIISLGANDFGRSRKSVEPGIAQLLQKIRQAGAQPAWVEPLLLPERMENEDIRQAWRDTGIPRFDSRPLEFPRASDGIHLHMSGYAAWAEKMWPWVVETSQKR